MTRFPVLVLVCAALPASPALSGPRGEAATSLIDLAPDIDTLADLLTPAPEKDPEDRAEEEHERENLIGELEAALKNGKPKVTRNGDLYELGTQRLARAAYLRDKAREAYEREWDRWFIGDALVEPTLTTEHAREELLKGLSHLREMHANAPTHFRRDELKFLIATTLARVGNDHCEAYFKEATQRATSKEWAMKATLARADFLVSKGRLDDAAKIYEEARKTAPSRLKAYATYRLGWTVLAKHWEKTGNERGDALKKAEAAFKLVVVTLEDDDDDRDMRFVLREEAAKDLAWLWALGGNEKNPVAFLENNDLDDVVPYYTERMAEELLNKGQILKAQQIYAMILEDDPEHPRAPDFRLRLGRAHVVAGNPAGMQKELAALKSMLGNEEDEWFEEYEDDAQRLERVKRMIAFLPLSAGFTLARASELEKDPAKKKKLLEGVVRELSTHISANPKDPDLHVIRLQLTQALMALNQPLAALAELDEMLKIGDKIKDQREAIITERMNLVMKLDAAFQYPPVPTLGEVKQPIPLPDLKRRFAQYAADWLALNPKHEQELPLRYQMAQDLFVYGHYDEAMRRFEGLIEEFPASEQAKVAIEVLLSMNLKRQRWDELVRLSTTFLNNRQVKGKALRDYVRENLDYGKQQLGEGT